MASRVEAADPSRPGTRLDRTGGISLPPITLEFVRRRRSIHHRLAPVTRDRPSLAARLSAANRCNARTSHKFEVCISQCHVHGRAEALPEAWPLLRIGDWVTLDAATPLKNFERNGLQRDPSRKTVPAPPIEAGAASGRAVKLALTRATASWS